MFDSIPENRGLPLAHLSQISTASFPSIRLRPVQSPDASVDTLIPDQLAADQPQAHLQRLIQQSMDSELLQKKASQRANTNQAQSALVHGLQKQAFAYTIVREQQRLLSASQSLGYG